MFIFLVVFLQGVLYAQTLVEIAQKELPVVQSRFDQLVDDPNADLCSKSHYSVYQQYVLWFVTNGAKALEVFEEAKSKVNQAMSTLEQLSVLEFELAPYPGQTESQAKASLNKVLKFIEQANKRRLAADANEKQIAKIQLSDYALNPTKINLDQVRFVLDKLNERFRLLDLESEGRVQLKLMEIDGLLKLQAIVSISFDRYMGSVSFSGQDTMHSLEYVIDLPSEFKDPLDSNILKLFQYYQVSYFGVPLDASLRFTYFIQKSSTKHYCLATFPKLMASAINSLYEPFSRFIDASPTEVRELALGEAKVKVPVQEKNAGYLVNYFIGNDRNVNKVLIPINVDILSAESSSPFLFRFETDLKGIYLFIDRNRVSGMASEPLFELIGQRVKLRVGSNDLYEGKIEFPEASVLVTADKLDRIAIVIHSLNSRGKIHGTYTFYLDSTAVQIVK